MNSRLRTTPGLGFTLIEVLVSLGILVVLSAGLLSLITGTLRFTSLSQGVSVSLEDVGDAEGYLNDLFRYARQVYAGLDVTIDGATFRCRLEGDASAEGEAAEAGRCIAVATPVVDATAAANIVDYDIVMLVVEPIENLYEADGLPRGWRGAETLVLLEYRIQSVCSGVEDLSACAADLTMGNLPQSEVVNEPGVLLLGLDDQNGLVAFFSAPSSIEAGLLLEVTLSVRAGAGRNEVPVVRQSNVSLEVLIRDPTRDP